MARERHDGPGPAPADAEAADVLPADLDVSTHRGPHTFPDNARRRIPGVLYLALAATCAGLWLVAGGDGVLVNDGFLAAAAGLGAFGGYCLAAAWPTRVEAPDALVAATGRVGFPVGHASASLGWRGLRSRPTWRILVYSAEEPPARRGLVLVDAVDGAVVEHLVERNPENWPEDRPENWPEDRPGDRPEDRPERSSG
ncbi:MAG: hypothetical protein ACRDZ9_07080 [Acidimicrobiales bacterium]